MSPRLYNGKPLNLFHSLIYSIRIVFMFVSHIFKESSAIPQTTIERTKSAFVKKKVYLGYGSL